jgi:hypothetical protein
MSVGGQEAHYDPIPDKQEEEDEASDYKLPDEPAAIDYAMHPIRCFFKLDGIHFPFPLVL